MISGTTAARMLPRLVLLVSALVALGLGHVTAHLCGPDPLSAAGICAHGGAVHSAGDSGMIREVGIGHDVHAATGVGMALYGLGHGPMPVVAPDTGSEHRNPFVLCLAAVSAILVALVLGLPWLGRRSEGVHGSGERPARLPPVRGSPPSPPFALSLRRVAVLRV